MSNILTDNTRTRRLAASVLAGVVLLGGMAGLSGTAMAAGAGTITLTAPADETLANHTFSAYKIGDYSGYADANANGKIDSTNVTNAAGTQAWLKAALAKAGLSVDTAKGLDEAGTLAATTQAAKLSTVANALADAANKPGAVVTGQTSNTGSLTLNVPGEGLYLVVDSDGLPIIVGTQINGKDLEHQALGTAVIKSTSISVDKEGSGDTTIGKTVHYTATFKIPQKSANPTKLSYTDQPTNLTIVRNSLKIKVGDQAAVAVPSNAITWNHDGGFTLTGDSYLSDATYGKTVVISYDATVTDKDPHNTGTVRATLADKPKTAADDVTLANFDFDLTKVKADGRTAVKGAGFVIKNQSGKYMKLDAASGKWSDTTIAGDYTIVGNTHNRFTRDGYEFQGWSQDPKATAASLRSGDIIDVPQAGADLYAVWKRVKTEPTPVPTLPQTGGMLGLIGGLVAVILLTGAGIAFKRRG